MKRTLRSTTKYWDMVLRLMNKVIILSIICSTHFVRNETSRMSINGNLTRNTEGGRQRDIQSNCVLFKS